MSKLILIAEIRSKRVISCEWQVINYNIVLSEWSLVPISMLTAPNIKYFFPLQLKTGGALATNTNYKFIVQCDGRVAAFVDVVTNKAPRGEIFNVRPLVGLEMKTLFFLNALNWTDSDLPLSYRFGLIALNGIELTVSEKSYSTSSFSKFPRGDFQLNYSLSCLVEVYDIFDTSTKDFSPVKVTPISFGEFSFLLSANLSSAAFSSELIDVASSVLNSVNCNESPSCLILNRYPCYEVASTCGECLNGYIGEKGIITHSV